MRLATVAVVCLMLVGIVGMLSRGGQESMAEVEVGVAVGAPAPATAPVTDSWASSVEVGSAVVEVEAAGGGIVAPVPASTPTPVSDQAWPLSLADAESVLLTAGWPAEWVAEGLSVACGYGNLRHPQGESGCDPRAVGASGEVGIFQIMRGWADWCGIDHQYLYLPLVNARCALAILQYEESIGVPRWSNWSVRP